MELDFVCEIEYSFALLNPIVKICAFPEMMQTPAQAVQS